MRRFIFIFISILSAIYCLLGCTSYQTQHWRNGILVNETQGTSSMFSSSYVVHENTQNYPNAVAGIGPMPGGRERVLAEQRVYVDETARNQRVLYGGYGYGGWGGYGGYWPQSYQRQIIPLSPGTRYPGQFYTPPPQPYYGNYSGW